MVILCQMNVNGLKHGIQWLFLCQMFKLKNLGIVLNVDGALLFKGYEIIDDCFQVTRDYANLSSYIILPVTRISMGT